MEQGGVELDGQKVTDVAAAVTAEQLSGEGIMLKKGKKVFHRAVLGEMEKRRRRIIPLRRPFSVAEVIGS